jgi:hypothetical protein
MKNLWNQDAWFDDDIWLDYVEGELTESHRQDLELLLKNSEKDHAIVSGIYYSKEVLKKAMELTDREKLAEPSDDELLAKIMARVDGLHETEGAEIGESERVVKLDALTRARHKWQSGMASLSLAAGIAGLISMSLLNPTVKAFTRSVTSQATYQASVRDGSQLTEKNHGEIIQDMNRLISRMPI